MKRLLGLTLVMAVTLLAGCAAHDHGKTAPAAPAQAIVTPDDSMTARVAMFNAVGRFVVLNFPSGILPANDQVFFIYRNGLKTGEVKITGPSRDTSIVADLVSGDAQAGDEVRDQ